MKKILFSAAVCLMAAACTNTPQAGVNLETLNQTSTQYIHTEPGNPYLPLWEHTPDGEPRIFEDPDNPGHMRVYVYYSHDTKGDSFCGIDTRCWSAPVDDLTQWRDEGAVFSWAVNGRWDTQFAPDITELIRKDGTKEYYLYPNTQDQGRTGLVAKSSSPVGPFVPINLGEDGNQLPGSQLAFDPGVFVEYVTDKNDPDFETGFRAYAFWGIIRSAGAQLDPKTMWSIRPGYEVADNFNPSCLLNVDVNDKTQNSSPDFLAMMAKRLGMDGSKAKASDFPLLYPDQNPRDFSFFEASSIRQVGNKYVLIWSGYSGPDYGLPLYNSTLRYAYGDTPFGPWKSGGILVDARGPQPTEDGSTLQAAYFGDNTHGSIQQMGDQWYVFYHRAPGYGHQNGRQAMVAPVNVEWDEAPVAEGGKVVITGYDPNAADGKWCVEGRDGTKYQGAELTSEGFYLYGLPPYRYYSAGYACMTSNENSHQIAYDIWNNAMPTTGVGNGDILGFKYFGFQGMAKDQKGLKAFAGTAKGDGTQFNIWLTPTTDKAFSIKVMMDGPWANDVWKGKEIARIQVPAGSAKEVTRLTADVASAVEGLDRKHAIYLVAEGPGENLCDIEGIGFSSAKHPIDRPEAPVVSITADDKALDIPAQPTLCTNDNGIVDFNVYDVTAPKSDKAPKIKATCTDKNAKISIDQPTAPGQPAVVKVELKGVAKYFRISF